MRNSLNTPYIYTYITYITLHTLTTLTTLMYVCMYLCGLMYKPHMNKHKIIYNQGLKDAKKDKHLH